MKLMGKPDPARGAAGRTVVRGAVPMAGVAALLVGAALMVPAMALAQAPSPGAAPAASERAIRFDIPAQDLNGALLRFADTSGLQVFFDTGRVRGLRSSAVAGAFSATDALGRLLAGSGLTFRMTGSNAVTLVALPAGADSGGAIQLPDVTVTGTAGRVWSPTPGYVAELGGTGTKTDTPLIETPQSISVITRDEMEARGVQSVQQAVRYTAGIRTETAGPQTSWDQMNVRGFSQGTLQFYRDGTLMAPPGYFGFYTVEPYALERIEILRGPSSVLYGQTGPSGLLNMVSKRPVEQQQNEVNLQLGSFDRRQVSFDSSGPLNAEKTLLYRFIAVGRDSDTQYDHVEDKHLHLSGALTYRPTAATSVTVMLDHQRDDGDYAVPLPAVGTARHNRNGRLSRNLFLGDPSFNSNTNTYTNVSTMLEHRVADNWTLRQNFRFNDSSGTRRALSGLALGADQRTITRSSLERYVEARGVVVDNQSEVRFSTGPLDHTLLTGFDYRWGTSSRKDKGGTAGVPTLDLYDPVYGRTVAAPTIASGQYQTARQFGLYAQDQIRFDDHWVLQLGGRLDDARSKVTNSVTGAVVKTDDRAATGRAGLVYLSDIGLAPYVSYSESFLPVGGTDIAGKAFEPETGVQHEAGVKYQPHGFNSFVTLSVFDLRRRNVTTPNPANPNFSVQTGEVRSRGVELEGKASLADGLSLVASYSYNDIEITRANRNAAGAGTQGKTPAGAPTHMASLWADYVFQSGALKGLGLGSGVRYIGETWGDDANSFKVKAFTLVDAAVTYDLGNLASRLQGASLAVNASNLFDRYYVGQCVGAAFNCFLGAERTVTANLKYRW